MSISNLTTAALQLLISNQYVVKLKTYWLDGTMTQTRNILMLLRILAWSGFAVVAILYLRLVFLSGFDHDEIEHINVIRFMAEGKMPFRDFPQNHFPLLWLQAYPLLLIFDRAHDLLIAARVFQLIPMVMIAIAVIRPSQLQSIRAPLLMAFLLLLLGHTEWYRFRPDPWAVAWMVLAVVLVKKPPNKAFFAGVCCALSLLTTPKLYPCGIVFLFYLSMPLVLGGLVCIAPFLTALFAMDLLGDFYREVIEFNRFPLGDLTSLSVYASEPLYYGILVILVWAFASELRVKLRDPNIVMLASGLLCLGPLMIGFHKSAYQLQGAIVFLMAFIISFQKEVRSGSIAAMATTVIVLALSWRSVDNTYHLRVPGWIISHEEMAWLGETIGAEDSCFGLSPFHPIFCKDVSTLTRGWDSYFLYHPNEFFRKQYISHVEANLNKVIEARPKFFVLGASWFDPTRIMLRDTQLDPQMRQKLNEMLTLPLYKAMTSPEGLILYQRQDSESVPPTSQEF
jgi:hypothetical protein